MSIFQMNLNHRFLNETLYEDVDMSYWWVIGLISISIGICACIPISYSYFYVPQKRLRTKRTKIQPQKNHQVNKTYKWKKQVHPKLKHLQTQRTVVHTEVARGSVNHKKDFRLKKGVSRKEYFSNLHKIGNP